MADRFDFYFRQKVTQSELDAAFAALETAEHRIVSDNLEPGIVLAGAVSEKGAGADLSVDVTGPGTVYDQTGQRITWPSLQNVDVSVDSASASTAVAGAGNSKIISVFAKFKRNDTDSRTDGNGNAVLFNNAESFEFIVRQSTEAVTPAAPALESDAILLADMTRAFGQTTIVNANLDTARRQDMFVVAGAALSLASGKVSDVFTAILGAYNAHIAGTADKHAAADVDYAGGGSWAGGTGPTNPATTAELQFDKIITDLAAVVAGATGAHRIGIDAIAGTTVSISAGDLRAAVNALHAALDPHISAGGGHQAGDIVFTGPATWYGAENLAATDVEAAIIELAGDLALTSSTGGAGRIGCGTFAGKNWEDGTARPAGPFSVFTAIEEHFDDLVEKTSGTDDGAGRIGAGTVDNLVSGSVRDQLNQLATNCASRMHQFGNTTTPGDTADNFLDPGFTDRVAGTTEAKVPGPSVATIKALRIRARTGPVTSGIVFTVRKNGSDTALTATLAAGGTAASDLANSFVVAAGDDLSVKSKGVAGITGGAVDVVATFVATLNP